MTDKKRDPLPRAYQFGDAGSSFVMDAIDESDGSLVIVRQRGDTVLYRYHVTANVIEGEHFESDADHHQTIEGEKV